MNVIDGSRELHGEEADALFARILQVHALSKQAIFDELMFQRQKWGMQDHTVPEWIMLLVEEIGEMTQAVLKGDRKSAILEAVQCSALLIQFMERVDRETDEQ